MFALQLLIVWKGGLWKVTSISIFKKNPEYQVVQHEKINMK